MHDLIEEPDFRIDPCLRDLLPPTTQFEDELLEIEVAASDGPDDPLIVWDEENILIDGHRRYAICKRRGLPYPMIRKSFLDRDHVVKWMLAHQVGRRNLLDHDKSILTAKLVKAISPGMSKVGAAEKASAIVGQSKRTTYRQIEYAEAFEQLPEPWRLAIESRDVKCPGKYIPKLAELEHDEQIKLLDQAIEAESAAPIQRRFPDPPSKGNAKTHVPQRLKLDDNVEYLDPDSPDVMNLDKRGDDELIAALFDTAEASLDHTSRAMDALFGMEGLNASASYRKRQIDAHIHGVNVALKNTRSTL
jgi:hypothetical protein